MMAMIAAARHSDSVSRTTRLVGGMSATHRRNSTTATKRDHPRANEPHGRGNGTARPRERKSPLVEHDEQQRKADHEGERESPLRLNEIQQFAHAVASSRTENSSTEPMPCTSARVAGPKPTSSRTRS